MKYDAGTLSLLQMRGPTAGALKQYLAFRAALISFASLKILKSASQWRTKARKLMKLSEFKFDLPNNLIALEPAENRDESRLMVVHKATGKIEHKLFKDVVNYFDEGDVMVGNDTMVFPARLYGRKEKTGAKIEVFLLRELNADMHLWDVLVDPARKIRVGNKLYFGDGDLVAEVIDNTTSRGRTIRFLFDGDSDAFSRVVETLGETPLPKYIKRKVKPEDKERFQTIYAKHKGAVSAPTAGLHFTRQLLKRLQIKGIEMGFVTLHIGLGTFRPVDVEDLTKHKMDSENFIVGTEAVKMVNEALDNKSRVCAVGTTTMRALESAVSATNRLKEREGWTDKFIFPPYDFKICSAMITNFHQPESTLMMMACAFGGYDLIMQAYQTAKKEKYKFLTYGDAMLII
jgi:S-adenosylmethionine:tRNA ribosyltransferase-isomerase